MNNWKKILIVMIPLIFVILAGCGETSEAASAIPTATATNVVQTSTATAIPTATLPADAQCAGNTNRQTQTLLDSHQIVVPANAVITNGAFGSDDGVQYSSTFQLFDLCASLMTPTQITSLYQSQMPKNGWQASSTFPYKAYPPSPCKTLCWEQPTSGNSTLAVALEDVSLSGEKTLFVLRYVSVAKN